MLTAMLQSLMGPRYPRRYVGRHRARLIVHTISTALGAKPRPSG
jgi:hypothetical protein